MNILAERALNSVEQGLLNAPPATLGFKPAKQQDPTSTIIDPAEAVKTEVEQGTHQLETLLCASIDRNFDKFEIYVLRNILCVRPPRVRDWIRLSHYEGLDFSSSAIPTTTNTTTTTTNTAAAENGGEDGNGNGNGNGNAEATAVTVTAANPDLPTLEGINKLRRKLRESMRLNALLTAERARNERLLEDLRRVVGAPSAGPAIKNEPSSGNNSSSVPPEAATDGNNNNNSSPFGFLHKKGDLTEAGPDTPLSTTTAFTLSQMEALRALSTSLRTMAPDLAAAATTARTTKSQFRRRSSRSRSRSRQPSSNDDDGDDDESDGEEDGEGREKKKKKKKSWRRERLEYVEGATRRHLETVQGLELGRDGEVRDGEWQGEGRTLARGEVEGLEKVVSLLGGEANSGGGGGGGGSGGKTGGGAEDAVEEEAEGEDADRMDES